MYGEHWSDNAIIEKLLIGSTRAGNDHLKTCPACARKWEEALVRRNRWISSEPEIPDSLFVKQHQAIRQRLHRPSRHHKLIPALAAAALALFAVLLLFRPVPPPPVQEADSDSAVFEDVFTISASTEPSSVDPVKSLFEVQQ